MTYKEYREKEQAEVNALPIFWAFSDAQFKKAMEERGLTENDTDKIYRFPGGGFYLKSDAQIIRDYFNRPNQLDELMKSVVFAEDAFYYEMANHEYHINWQGDWDVCSCFGHCEYEDGKSATDYLLEMGYGNEILSAWYRAKISFLKDAEENGWY